MSKKRVVKDYDALPEDILMGVKNKYPSGYEQHLITYMDAKGKKVSALPFETDDIYFLIRMTVLEAKRLVKEDEDFDDEGQLIKENVPDVEVEVDDEFDGAGEDDDDTASGLDDEDDHIIVTRRRGSGDDEDDVADERGGGDEY